MATHYLSGLFEPRGVAVFGASERAGSVGTLVFKNLLEGGFQGELFPINPKYPSVQGKPAFASLKSINQPVDLAVIMTPAETVPAILESCGEHGVRYAVVLSAGFREVGERGARLEQDLMVIARRYKIRFLGPNCLGLIRPWVGLNATFNKGNASRGKLALVSQSGAICTAILDWAAANNIGFSNVVSLGISADIDFGEILDYLAVDSKTESILLYIEGIRDARSFMSGLRACSRVKPVIALKVGRHVGGSKAVVSHTGAMVGRDDVFEAALNRAGVVRGMRVSDLFSAASILTAGFHVGGERLAIVTNGGGPGVMASDRAADLDVPLATLSGETLAALDRDLPPTWSHGNPVDVVGDAGADRFTRAVEICLGAEEVDGVLAMVSPQAMTQPLEMARALIPKTENRSKPILTCWMGQKEMEASRAEFAKAGVPSFSTPETAIEAYSYLLKHYRNQQLLVQTPGPMSLGRSPDVEGARLIIESALAEKRSILSETESKAILSAFRIPTARSVVVHSPQEALIQAEAIGFPVALKVNSPDITHKSDAGGVILNIGNAHAVRSAYHDIIQNVRAYRPDAVIDGVCIEPMLQRHNGRELLVGIVKDPVFGPVISFGSGGLTAEAMRDRAVSLPPLNRSLIEDMVGRTRISKVLGPFRHMPAVNMDALVDVLLRVSELACELPFIKELDINPLIVDETGAVAADARVVVEYALKSHERYGHMAIHPYPSHLVDHWQLPDGTEVTMRPIRPEDAAIEQEFVRALSAKAKFFRFMMSLEELSPKMLARFTQIDYDREMAFIATVEEAYREKEIGVARYIINPDGESCEFAIVVADQWQGHGIGRKLIQQLADTARHKGLKRMEGEVLVNNQEMLALAKTSGFAFSHSPEDPNIMLMKKNLLGD